MWFKTRLLPILVLAVAFWLGIQTAASASPLAFQTSRVAGLAQIDTAIEVSKSGWMHSDTVILATADNYPDALVAAPLSHKLDAPILLNHRDELDPRVLSEINRLGAKKVIVLGGEAALGPKVVSDLNGAGKVDDRIFGDTQYDTAIKVAERIGSNGQIILASGEQYADALSISAYAGATETPILLTKSQVMPDAVHQELTKLTRATSGSTRTIVVGGEAVVSSNALVGIPGVTRVAGWDRYETAADVHRFAQDTLTSSVSYLVSGENYPDALVAGALAAKNRSQLLLSESTIVSPMTYSVLDNPNQTGQQLVIIGGTAVLSDRVKSMVEGKIPLSYPLAGLTIVVDPGHGGGDSGAQGYSGTWEKNNTLPTGIKLADLLRSAGAQVILTRSTDTSLVTGSYIERSDLAARVDIANAAHADLFVSIHNDSFTSSSAHGTTTYYSSESPVAGQSLAFGQKVQAQLVSALGLYNRGVKAANFYVVKYTSMPAILVELGFISNPNEEKLLGSSDFQSRAVQGIYQGILAYTGR